MITKEKIKENRITMLRHTKKGTHLHLGQMHTGHIFNSLKLLYMSLVERYNAPTTYQQKYDCSTFPKQTLASIITYIAEIEERGDLSDAYKQTYTFIVTMMQQIIKKREDIEDDILQQDIHHDTL